MDPVTAARADRQAADLKAAWSAIGHEVDPVYYPDTDQWTLFFSVTGQQRREHGRYAELMAHARVQTKLRERIGFPKMLGGGV